MTVKEFKSLEVAGDPDSLARFLKEVSSHLGNGWGRDKKREEKLHVSGNVACFVCLEGPGRPAAALWLAHRGTSQLYVSNIAPTSKRQLTHDEYNAVLDDFADSFAVAVATSLGLKVTRTAGILRMEDYLSTEAYESLKKFSASANRATGSSHPMDAARWLDFVVRAHREQARLTPYDLERWLSAQDWDDELSLDLAIEYEQSRELLRFYDQSR